LSDEPTASVFGGYNKPKKIEKGRFEKLYELPIEKDTIAHGVVAETCIFVRTVQRSARVVRLALLTFVILVQCQKVR